MLVNPKCLSKGWLISPGFEENAASLLPNEFIYPPHLTVIHSSTLQTSFAYCTSIESEREITLSKTV